MLCFGVDLIVFILFETLWASWTCMTTSFTRLGKFPVIISSNKLASPCSSISPRLTPIMWMLLHLILSQSSLQVFLFLFFSFCFSGWVFSAILYSKSLIWHFLLFYFVVQVQLSPPFSPYPGPPPHPSLSPTLEPTSFSFVCVSFIRVPWWPWSESWTVWKARCLLRMAGSNQGEFTQKKSPSSCARNSHACCGWASKDGGGGGMTCSKSGCLMDWSVWGSRGSEV